MLGYFEVRSQIAQAVTELYVAKDGLESGSFCSHLSSIGIVGVSHYVWMIWGIWIKASSASSLRKHYVLIGEHIAQMNQGSTTEPVSVLGLQVSSLSCVRMVPQAPSVL